MTIHLFGSLRQVGAPALLLAFPAAALFGAAFSALYSRLNENASPDVFLGPPAGRFWAVAGGLGLAAFLYMVLEPLLPGWRGGGFYWPLDWGPRARWLHSGVLTILGALAFWTASSGGLAGSFDRWRPRAWSPAWTGLWLSGALTGLGAGVAGAGANRWLFLARALHKADWKALGYGAAASAAAALPLSAALFLLIFHAPPDSPRPAEGDEFFTLPEGKVSGWLRALWGALLAAAWILPAQLTEAHLSRAWDYGRPDLASAAQVPGAQGAGSVRIIVLADSKGRPGTQEREEPLAAEGVDLSPPSLEKLRRYLEARSFRSLFAREAVAALRRGWALDWNLDRYLDAASLHGRSGVPADFPGFLAAIRTSPVTQENFTRLQAMAEYARGVKLVRVDQTQKLYEGFSAAFAHFGEMKDSNLWLDKIQGLWPLYSEDIQVEPVEQDLDCAIAGEVSLDGRPATSVKVGLFAIRSTNTVVGAGEGLVDAVYPEESGAFEFSHLTPGRYYLALQAPAGILPAWARISSAPGAVRLTPEHPVAALAPVALETSPAREISPPPI